MSAIDGGAYSKKLVDVMRVNNQKLLKENKALQDRIAQLEDHIRVMEETYARKYALFDDFEDEMTPRNVEIDVTTSIDPVKNTGVVVLAPVKCLATV